MSVIHHLEISVSKINQANQFYTPVLTALGFKKLGRVRLYVKDDFLLLRSRAENQSRYRIETTMIYLNLLPEDVMRDFEEKWLIFLVFRY